MSICCASYFNHRRLCSVKNMLAMYLQFLTLHKPLCFNFENYFLHVFLSNLVSFFFYRSPEMIMMCLIMDAHPSEDVSVHIQHTLIEAYCFEQDMLGLVSFNQIIVCSAI
jgi:hypothetical protein